MLRPASRLAVLALALLFGACASRPLPKYEKPIARASVQSVRTTAYTHTESDHIRHGQRNALGSTLQYGDVRSAAADWSRWPAGTVFRIRETGEIYRVDDYGWALSGTNTIDLYKPSRSAMNSWGVRRVTIENLQWGDVDASLAILKGRSKFKHVRRMIDQIEDRYADLKRPVATPEAQIALATPAPAPAPIPMAQPVRPAAPVVVAAAQPVRRAEPVRSLAGATASAPRSGVPLTPFQATR